MSTRDIRSNLLQKLLFNAAISTNTTTDAVVIDLADFDMGVMISLAALAFTDGSYNLIFEDSPDNSVFTAVSSDKIIGPGATVSALTDPSVPDELETVGLFSIDRFLKVRIVSTGTTTGATIAVLATIMGEQNPVAAQT